MRKFFVIQDIETREFFAGADPKPIWATLEHKCPVFFDTEEQAETRLNVEFNLFGEQDRTVCILPVFVI